MKVGDNVGHFRVIARLGRGGMGEVWLAEHPVVRKRVAVKAIPADRAVKSVARDRFLAEARAVAALSHPHVVTMHDFGDTEEGDLYFTMEFLDGESLARRLEDVKKLPVSRAVSIVSQIADALTAAHDHGVVHRDLKPDNIYLLARAGGADFVKVLDFGLAKQMDGSAPFHTAEGHAIGTPEYMAPEQCVGRRDLDARVDVYALGCLLYEMVTGAPPFRGDSADVMRAHRDRPPDLTPLPPSLQPLVARALAKDRDQRFPSVAELASALTDLPPTAPLPDSSTAPTREVIAQPRRRLWIALGAAALLVAGGGLLLARRARTPPDTVAAALPGEKPRRTLSVESVPPGAEVVVDDIAYGASPVTVPIDAERSAVILEVQKPGFNTWRGVIDPARSTTVEAVLTPAPAAASTPRSAPRPPKPKPATGAEKPFDDTGVMAPTL